MKELNCSNRLVISGTLAVLEELRYTPAGIARIGLKIQHVSSRSEAGSMRQVSCEIPALAFAETALRVSQLRLGQQVEAEGFLAQRSLQVRQLVLHIERINIT